jgi:hypothetical protein
MEWSIMFKFLSGLLAAAVLATSSFAAINPNQIQGYQTVFTGKNVIVNGGSEVAQINGTTLITPTSASYPIDNVQITTSVAGVFQSVQVNSTNVATYATGYLGSLGATNALRWSVLATNGAPAAGAEFASYYPIEGLNFSRFEYGTANAKVGSLQFKVHCTLAGTNTYSGAIKNYANTRAYPFSYSCTAGTDAQIYIQNIPGDTGGTWVGNTNAGAAYITFDLGSGANFKTTANAWATGDYNGVTGTTNLSAQANGSTLTITDVQFEVGAFSTQFERKMYNQVLAECSRYLPVIYSGTSAGSGYGAGSTYTATLAFFPVTFPVQTRVPPTAIVTESGGNAFTISTATNYTITTLTFGSASVTGAEIDGAVSGATAGQGGYIRWVHANDFIYLTGAQI